MEHFYLICKSHKAQTLRTATAKEMNLPNPVSNGALVIFQKIKKEIRNYILLYKKKKTFYTVTFSG